jgi:predicted translin family RNA/ssDNA-binding protein
MFEFRWAAPHVRLQRVSCADGAVGKTQHLQEIRVRDEPFILGVQQLVSNLTKRCLRVVQESMKFARAEPIVAFSDQVWTRSRGSTDIVAESTIARRR